MHTRHNATPASVVHLHERKLFITPLLRLVHSALVNNFLTERAVRLIRRAHTRFSCLKYKVSYITTIAGALAAVKGIESVKNGNGGEGGVKSLQEYHSLIK